MANVERRLKSPPGEEIQIKQNADNSIVLITSNKTEDPFLSAEDALSRKKDALIFNNALLVIRGFVVAAVVGEIGMLAAGEPIFSPISIGNLGLIAVGVEILSIAARPNPKLIKRQIAEIKAFAKKDTPAK
jgi:hypothetical protein